jgi:hypothetical protein
MGADEAGVAAVAAAGEDERAAADPLHGPASRPIRGRHGGARSRRAGRSGRRPRRPRRSRSSASAR